MSNNDSFIDEVTEEVRRDRLFALFRRYGWIGIVLILTVVIGAAWREWAKAQTEAKAEAFGDSVLSALSAEDPAQRLAGLDAVAGEDGQTAVLAFLTASQAETSGDKVRAVEALKGIATDAALPESYRHLAELKRILLLGAEMDAAERDAILASLSEPGKPFRPLAMEQQALALVAAGKAEEAIDLCRQILNEPTVTAALRRRATEVIVALGGDPASE